MEICVRRFEERDLEASLKIWNQVIGDGIAFPFLEELEPEENFKASLPGDTPSHTLEIITREEDLDLNAHVNNTHYAAWAIQSVPPQIRAGKRLDRILLSFKNECRSGEKILVGVFPCGENAFWHTLIRQSDGKEAARIYTRWI